MTTVTNIRLREFLARAALSSHHVQVPRVEGSCRLLQTLCAVFSGSLQHPLRSRGDRVVCLRVGGGSSGKRGKRGAWLGMRAAAFLYLPQVYGVVCAHDERRSINSSVSLRDKASLLYISHSYQHTMYSCVRYNSLHLLYNRRLNLPHA